ncbi:MAG: ribbon-helix-helix domain-containing protein [Ktedonobacteraceae bacterium]
MPKERITVYITTRQKEQLHKKSQDERLPGAELIRRALDAYLAWDDPHYRPQTASHKRNSHSSPP